MQVKNFFSIEEKNAIMQAIADAELNTSGEIRVHLDSRCNDNPVDRAINVFNDLKMYETKARNGVLIYIAIDDHKFAIIGDKGINEVVEENFWDKEKELILNYFKINQFAEGICEGIKLVGEKLKLHFPYQDDDTNELTNEISFEK
jgi:uncharacterized membrane protein